MKKKHPVLFIVAAFAATILSHSAVGKDFAEPSLEELAAIDLQLADAFVAYAKTSAGRDQSAIFLEASEVFANAQRTRRTLNRLSQNHENLPLRSLQAIRSRQRN